MIVLIVAREERLKEIVNAQFISRGASVIHYRNPIKAMDNLEEIRPDIVIFYTQDFPRHWKPFMRFYRSLNNLENGIAVLLTGDLFTEDEAAKAQLLGVNGLVPYPQEEQLVQSSLEEIIQRYVALDDQRRSRRYTPRDYDTLAFMFPHPESFTILTGTVLDITVESIRFYPDALDKTAGIPENTLLENCSLQVDDKILTFACRLLRNNKSMIFAMEGLGSEDEALLTHYFAAAAERALASQLS